MQFALAIFNVPVLQIALELQKKQKGNEAKAEARRNKKKLLKEKKKQQEQ